MAALGLVVKSPAGFPVENPYLGIVKRALIEMHRWGKELGIISHTSKTKPTPGPKPNTIARPLSNLRLRTG